MDSDFQTVAKVGDIPEGQGRCFAVNGTMVGVFLHKGQYFAINDFCPHMGASLSEGHVAENGAVMCPWHAWSFRLDDGTWMDNRRSGIRTDTYKVRVVDDQIQVCVPVPQSPSAEEKDSTAEDEQSTAKQRPSESSDSQQESEG